MKGTTRRLNHVALVSVSNVDKKTAEGDQDVILCNYVDVYKNENIVDGLAFMRATATEDQVKTFSLRAGDSVITKDSETAEDIGIPAYVPCDIPDLVCGYHLAIARPKPNEIAPKFLFWCLNSNESFQRWAVLATGVTRVGLRQSDIGKLPLWVPDSVADQKAIAEFLDRETAQIDALIGKQERLVDVLDERRSAMITHAVTRGLDSGAPLRDSGVAWLGDMPASWRIKPLWTMFGREKSTGFPDEEMLSVYRDHGVIRKSSRLDNGNKTAQNRDIYQIVDVGWLVANRMKAWQGSVGISPLRGIVSGHYIVFRPKHVESNAFLNYLFRSRPYTHAYGLLSRGVRIGQAEIDNDHYRTLPVVLPPIKEQVAIVDRLERDTAKIDALIAKAKAMNVVLRERRSALISAAVTGKIDVTKGTEGAA